MKTKRVFLAGILLILLVACGGGNNEPAASGNAANATTEDDDAGANDEAAFATEADANAATEEEGADDAVADEEGVESEEMDEAAPDEANEEPATEEAVEEAAVELYRGIDPETGLEINPEPIPFGVEFIARGEVISMNLTPQTEPEFVIRGPNGIIYRIATQALSDIYLLDGSQLQPFEYRQGMEAMATVLMAADASLSDVLSSGNFVIIVLP